MIELKQYSLRTKIQTEDVVSMLLIEHTTQETDNTAIYTDGSYPSVQEAPNETLITDPEEITKILSQIQYPAGRLLGYDTEPSCSVDIMLKGNSGSHYYPLGISTS